MASHVAARQGPKLGKKAVYLPNFTLTLLRTPTHPPTFASFIVPLNLNKLDLRDYLFNVYGISVRGVRSYVQQQKLVQAGPRKAKRPRSIKKMMVEMDQPFIWPEEPKDFDLWDKKTYEAAKANREVQESEFQPGFREKPTRERGSIAEQAKALLTGETKWRNTPNAEEWEDVGEPTEVEADVDISKATK